MIDITVFKKDNKYNGFSVNGHANYAEKGKDIVCAAISALTYGTIESITQIAPTKADYRLMDGNAVLLCDETTTESDLLIRSFKIGVSQIADQYPYNVRVTEVQQ